MQPEDVVMIALASVVSVAAGAELVYYMLAGRPAVALWAALFLALGLLSGRLIWP